MTPSPRELIERFDGQKILVFGDIMLDRYWWGDVTRISPEAPVPIFRKQNVSTTAGGAANTALNLAALGADVVLFGAIGDDEAGRHVIDILRRHEVNVSRVVRDPSRPTTTKTRVVSQQHHMLRIDEEDVSSLNGCYAGAIVEAAASEIQDADAVVISDYTKGFVTTHLAQEVISRSVAAKKSVLIDPKGSDYSKYESATILKPNRAELAALASMAINDHEAVVKAGRWLKNQLRGSTLVVTEGKDGMTVFLDGEEEIRIPTVAREVYDVTGAGDTVIAMLAIAVAAGANLRDAAVLANHAAGCVVGEVGTTVISRSQLLESLNHSGV